MHVCVSEWENERERKKWWRMTFAAIKLVGGRSMWTFLLFYLVWPSCELNVSGNCWSVLHFSLEELQSVTNSFNSGLMLHFPGFLFDHTSYYMPCFWRDLCWILERETISVGCESVDCSWLVKFKSLEIILLLLPAWWASANLFISGVMHVYMPYTFTNISWSDLNRFFLNKTDKSTATAWGLHAPATLIYVILNNFPH